MPDHHASDLVTIVRSQRATVEALNRVVHMRARIRSTIAAIDRAEEQIQQMRLLLDRERAGASEPNTDELTQPVATNDASITANILEPRKRQQPI